MSKVYHIVAGRAYGPANLGESIREYKDRVRGAYGSLHGVRFVEMQPGAKHDPIYVVTGQSDQGKIV